MSQFQIDEKKILVNLFTHDIDTYMWSTQAECHNTELSANDICCFHPRRDGSSSLLLAPAPPRTIFGHLAPRCSLTTFTSSPSSVCYDGRNRMNVDIMSHTITLSGWFSPLTFMMSKKPGNPSTVMLVIQNSVLLHWQLCA